MRASLLSAAFVCCLAATGSAPAQAPRRQPDMFAEIAARQIDYSQRDLVPVEPRKLDRRTLAMDPTGTTAAFVPMDKITTAEQLREELGRQRQAHAPFLADLAPPLADVRIRVPIESFGWRVETEADRLDFAGHTLAGKGPWKSVKIPHYGGPMGRAATCYRTEFAVTPEMLRQGALFVRFKGVDYKAHVFVNGALLGSHEGVFAPFEFEFTPHARLGKNVLLVKVTNDFTMLASNDKLGYLGYPVVPRYFGDKIFAGVGPNWDEPGVGWHCCAPGMGIYQDVAIEARRRVFVHDLFVRPLSLEGKAEAWVEVFGCDPEPQEIAIRLSVFGQNFAGTVFADQACVNPHARDPRAKVAHQGLWKVQPGVNCYKVPIAIPRPRLWDPASPWLYQLQVKLEDAGGRLLDTAKGQFGIRTFRMEYAREPKGRMELNGREIRLRGANTMGAFQQCVIRKDWRQLADDILLAKITNMNYIRLTQMPVQEEIYRYCDRLGLMLQTDLPLFATVHRSQFCEVVRQAEEMERLVRSHPSNIMVTYMNEPTPKSAGQPYRNITREEMIRLFESADVVVRMNNPDRVIKAVDGDYDPPGPGLSDNHCYTGWYNGHGIEMGMLHKGFWQRVKPGWRYGCGEFGSEGLDPVALMRKHYPQQWLPAGPREEKTWSPDGIPGAQTGSMHYGFFETPDSLDEWVRRSQSHQAWATRIMAEAFRRDTRMQSFAIHLFIDAFPASWMKAIMDCQRTPKPAWFAYRDALTPLAVSLRSDRRAFFSGEPLEVEAWIANDRHDVPQGATLHYQLELDGKVLQAGSTPAGVPPFDSAYQGSIRCRAPELRRRAAVTLRLGLLDRAGRVLHDTAATLDVFPPSLRAVEIRRAYVVGAAGAKAAQLAADLGAAAVFLGPFDAKDAILIDDMKAFAKVEAQIARAVRQGARAIFLELPAGKYRIGPGDVTVAAGRGKYHFVSRATGHRLVAGLEREDFKFWYDVPLDRPSPLLTAGPLEAAGWEPVLVSFGQPVAAWKPDGPGAWCVCQIDLTGRIPGNPVAEIFARRLLAR